MRIGYLATHYPAVSHTFVLREVEALRRLGVEVETFSIHRTPDSELLSEADRHAAATTFAVIGPRPSIFVAHLAAFAARPARYLQSLALALRLASPGLRGRLWGLFYFAEAIAVWRKAQRMGVHHLHAQFADGATDVALLVSHFGGVGWSWSMAIHGPVEFYDVRLNRLPEKVRRARFMLAISHFGRSQLMTIADEADWGRIHVVHCGVDLSVFAPDGGRRADGVPHLLCVGRLVHLKGHSLLIEALGELSRRGTRAVLTFVGDGPKRIELEELALDLGVADRVRFVGAVGQDAIRDIYGSADVFCLPSLAEGLPVVLMEAMAFEVPVVSTRIMGIPELVDDGRSGLLVTPSRLDELTDALERLITDPALRARLGRAGREKVQAEFDIDRSARRLRDIFAAALSEAP
jgi:colanic acid/amylovoran biosynthesis glycosyltransferase